MGIFNSSRGQQRDRAGSFRRKKTKMQTYQPQGAADELQLPLPDTQRQYMGHSVYCILSGELPRRDRCFLRRRALRDSLFSRRVVALPSPEGSTGVTVLTSPTIELLRAQVLEDISINVRDALARKSATRTALKNRLLERARLLEQSEGERPSDAGASPAVMAEGDDYRARRAARARHRLMAASAEAASAARERLEELDREITELREVDEADRLMHVTSALIARYDQRARFYLGACSLPRSLREVRTTLVPNPVTPEAALAHLRVDLAAFASE